jgi:hypothetical protein
MSIVTTETRCVCSSMLGTKCMVGICIRVAKEHHIPNSNKTRGSAHWACIAHLTIEW